MGLRACYSNKRGSLKIEKGAFSESERNVANYLKEKGHNVTLRNPTRTKHAVKGKTSDIVIKKAFGKEVNVDVYTPKTNKIDNILTSVANKNKQAQHIVVDLSKTNLKAADFGKNYMARIKGKLIRRPNFNKMYIKKVEFVRFD